MSMYTPRPWKAVYVGSSDWDLDGPTTQEDWTLAAAAPDLLEALEAIYDRAVFDYNLPADHFAAEGARTAIAKAKGEQA